MKATLEVYVQPRSSTTGIVGWRGDALKIRVAAPPAEGAANAELVRFLGEALGLPRSAVKIVKGAAARRKRVVLSGIDTKEALAKLDLLVSQASKGGKLRSRGPAERAGP
ncbi:MAG: UPF0235 protein [Gemmatimonadales bacterium]|nr:MAG: UPF0235 protein [Gemmatimonadales bacterium]